MYDKQRLNDAELLMRAVDTSPIIHKQRQDIEEAKKEEQRRKARRLVPKVYAPGEFLAKFCKPKKKRNKNEK